MDTKIIVDCSTGETTIVPLTAEEISEREAAREAAIVESAARQAEEERVASIKASARAKLVAGEPLTEEEANYLVI